MLYFNSTSCLQLFYFAKLPFTSPVVAAPSQAPFSNCPEPSLIQQPVVISAITIACFAFALAFALAYRLMRQTAALSPAKEHLLQ